MWEQERKVRVWYVGIPCADPDVQDHAKQFFRVEPEEGGRAQHVISLGNLSPDLTYWLSRFDARTGGYAYRPNHVKGRERMCVPLWLIPPLQTARADCLQELAAVAQARLTAPPERVDVLFLGTVPSGHPSDPSCTHFFNVLFAERDKTDPLRNRGVKVRDAGLGLSVDFCEGARFLRRLNGARLIHSADYTVAHDGNLAIESAKIPPWLAPALQDCLAEQERKPYHPQTLAQRNRLKPAYTPKDRGI